MNKDLSVEQVSVEGVPEETISPVPQELMDAEQVRSIVARSVAESLVPAMQALLPEMMKTLVPNYANGPTGVTHVPMVENAPEKPGYLKHYRMDGVLSGKYQLIDVSRLDENGEIPYITSMGPDGRWRGETPAILKGEWIHFQNEHFYATKQIEVDFVDWKIANDPNFRAYEDKNFGGDYQCGVVNCGKKFADSDTLTAHMKATHGV